MEYIFHYHCTAVIKITGVLLAEAGFNKAVFCDTFLESTGNAITAQAFVHLPERFGGSCSYRLEVNNEL